MKPLKYFALIGAALFALTFTAQAHLEFVGAGPKTGGNSPDDNLAFLGTFVDTTGFVLCGNLEEGITNPVSVMAGAYLVIHYGKGNNGSNAGGGLEVYHVVGGETSVDVPLTGTSEFGNGGISSLREFCPPGTSAPDSGTTAMLLGSALAGLGVVRRYLKR